MANMKTSSNAGLATETIAVEKKESNAGAHEVDSEEFSLIPSYCQVLVVLDYLHHLREYGSGREGWHGSDLK